MGRPLAGVRVVDLSHLLPGPFCGLLLSRLGASVTKVELPHFPDRARGFGSLFSRVNRGKRHLRLDYAKPAGRRRLERLLARADVLIEGFRPGLMDRLGLGPEALLKAHPRLVYCSITGYGRGGERWAGHDMNYQARAGLLSGLDGAAVPHVPVADLAGAYSAALGVVAALRRRDREGRGGLVDVSMAESALSFNVLPLSAEKGLSWYRANPFYRVYPCKGGGAVAVGALEKAPALWLLRLLGLERLAPMADRWEKNAALLERALSKAFLRRTRDAWARVLEGQEVCVTPVLSPREALAARRGGNQPRLL